MQQKKALHLPEEKFYVPEIVKQYFKDKLKKQHVLEEDWKFQKKKWDKAFPTLKEEFEKMETKALPQDIEEKLSKIEMKKNMASRASSGYVINEISKYLPFVYGGSADLSCSDKTMLNDYKVIATNDFSGRNIKYGVREFAMGTIANGLFLSGMILPFCGTFLVFSDYLRSAIRIAALSSYKVIYQFTHDSIFLGEDGPTHQPIEQIASLRAIPNLHVIRPADSYEVKMAWLSALKYKGPTAILLSRQSLVDLVSTHVPYNTGLAKGAYIVKKEKLKPDFSLLASGSEVSLAFEVANKLELLGKEVRIVSFPCFELFEKQDSKYKELIIGGDIGKKVSIEAGVDQGWYKYIGKDGIAISLEDFGMSAPEKDIKEECGFNVDDIIQHIM